MAKKINNIDIETEMCDTCCIDMYFEKDIIEIGYYSHTFVCLSCYLVKCNIFRTGGAHLSSYKYNRSYDEMVMIGYIPSMGHFNFDLSKCSSYITKSASIASIENNTSIESNTHEISNDIQTKTVHSPKSSNTLYSKNNSYSFNICKSRKKRNFAKNKPTKMNTNNATEDDTVYEYDNSKKWRCYACHETAILGEYHCIACHVNFNNISYCNNKKCSRYNKRGKTQEIRTKHSFSNKKSITN